MDYRVLIIEAIALLYWESTLENSGLDSKELVGEILKDLPSPDTIAGTDDDRENLHALKNICQNMVYDKTNTYTREYLESKLRISIKKDPELRDDVISTMAAVEGDDESKINRIKTLRDELYGYLHRRSMKDAIKKIAQRTIFAGAENFDCSKMAREIIATIEPFVKNISNDNEDPSLNGSGTTEDKDAIAKMFMNVQEDLSPDSVLKTGWQAMNRMFGEVGGLRRGNMYVIGAMPSNGKSLISSCLTLQVGLFNTPYLFDQTKKPAIVHISTENDMNTNLKIWFRYLWENEYDQPCNLQDMDPQAMAEWFINKLESNGYKYFFYHIDPTKTVYSDIISRLIKLESEGYEIHLATVDYLAMINGDGLGDSNAAFWIRQLFKVLRNHCNPRRITLITPHQVATDAAALKRQGSDDFVKEIAGKRYWEKCRSIDMEVDCEIVLNIEKDDNGNAWMAFGRGKDRSSQNTPEKDKFFFLPFSQNGGLRMDLNGKDTSRKSIRGTGTMVLDDAWVGGDNSEF